MRAAEKAELRKAEQELNDFMNNREFEHVKSDPFINEETEMSQSTLASYRVRPDHFKGFNKAQTMYIYKKNEELVGDHKEMKAEEARVEAGWASHTEQVVRLMEQAEQQQKDMANQVEMLQDADIQAQREELKYKTELSRRDKYGAITEGFFDGFGTSCR
jgi:hypothetical protein